ncbi:MAG TPA: hypothetical protein DEP66_02680 [Acidimicrobiaceae bacterium]|nr:hypothetical protein [Acidimicrobiaceae bacterium]HCB37128.1 hypothetical protein [Acidimicrobiaceae bacterium]
MSKFVLAVDVDGVCADYTAGFRTVVKRELGYSDDDLGPPNTWAFTEWNLDGQFDRLHDLAVTEHRIYRTVDPIEGCADALWRLSDAGAWIRLVTHRLYSKFGHSIVVSDTVEWLDKHSIPYRDLCFLGDKSDVDAAAYIEDGPHNIERIRALGRHVVVFDQGYNREFAPPRAQNWVQAEAQVMDLLTAHQGSVEPTLPGTSTAGERLSTRRRGRF